MSRNNEIRRKQGRGDRLKIERRKSFITRGPSRRLSSCRISANCCRTGDKSSKKPNRDREREDVCLRRFESLILSGVKTVVEPVKANG
ncbi:hypothetical protein GWI33_008388 [Rhynchophorus ferrugineus]|uniref:Uncharacterized protein n=1 Tax=Rhynchophorus ferrugineus TaxID=354439 RepID=A0A834IR78_RHYFE|nr:hypothetical protein GWI33_008388 [Rhynchophorus ferrugineus]